MIHWADKDSLSLENVNAMVVRLKEMPHLACIRICSKKMAVCPDIFTRERIETIAGWCDFSIENSVKIEIETWFLHPDDILARHLDLSENFVARGVTVYANVPLVRGLNDDPGIMVRLAHKLRWAGIEFHHVYVGGLEIQNRFNHPDPIEAHSVIDVASAVRKNCSGRQIPLYMVQTARGETDFGLEALSSTPWGC